MLLTLEQYYIVSLSWLGTCSFVAICIWMICFFQLCILDSSAWIDTLYRNLTVITMLAFIFCSVGDCVHIFIRFLYFPHLDIYNEIEAIIATINDSSYYIALLLFYVLLTSRIKAIFGLRRLLLCFLLLLICNAGLTSIAYCCSIMMFRSNQRFKYQGMTATVLSINDFILNSSLFIIFWCKLRRSIIGIEVMSINDINHRNNVNLLTNVMTKHCVLFGIAVITNQGFFVYTVYDTLFYSNIDNISRDILNAYLVRSIQIMVNINVLFLVLRVNYKRYIKLCKYCHICISKCCIKDTQNVTEDPYRKLPKL